jgi:hypothetical protein
VAAGADVTTQTDARDYEALSYLPNNTLIPLMYVRDISSADSQNYSVATGVFRAAYILKFGNLSVVPVDFYLPMEDVTVYTPAATIHTSGFADFTYVPSVGYTFTEDEATKTHSYIAASAYITMPTGGYNANQPVNTGDHRWSFQPQIAAGQRFMKFLTVEAVGNVTFHTANGDFVVPTLGQQSLKAKPAWGLDSHLAADISPTFYFAFSYYLVANGRTYFDLQTPAGVLDQTVTNEQTVQSVRFTLGVRIATPTLLLLQMNQDVAASGGGTISRFFGMRFSHAFAPFSG